jgi:uncharacterized protein YeaO (DUF488 family)
MLKQSSVTDIRNGNIHRDHGYIVITMCFYPRGLRTEFRDEYHGELAPDKKLFKDWQAQKELHGHELAFEYSDYEARFTLSEEAWDHLERLADLSNERDVYFVCQCDVGEKCHREILMLLAEREFHAKIAKVYHQYPRALARLHRFHRSELNDEQIESY